MITRRLFMGAAVAIPAAPAIVRASSLMPRRTIPWSVAALPIVYGRMAHEYTAAAYQAAVCRAMFESFIEAPLAGVDPAHQSGAEARVTTYVVEMQRVLPRENPMRAIGAAHFDSFPGSLSVVYDQQ